MDEPGKELIEEQGPSRTLETDVPPHSTFVSGNPVGNSSQTLAELSLTGSFDSIKARKRHLARNIDQRLVKQVCERLSQSKRVRRTLLPWGRVSIDRQLPFLCVFRRRGDVNSPGDERFVMGEAAFITADADLAHLKPLTNLIGGVADLLSEKFEAFLVVEIWISHYQITEDMPASGPRFNLYVPREGNLSVDFEDLAKELKRIKIQSQASQVQVIRDKPPHPPELEPLVPDELASEKSIFRIGLEIFDVYRDSQTKQAFPLIKQKLLRGFSRALKRLFFDFTQTHTSYRPPNYQALGRRSLVKAVWEIDEKLADISRSYDLVLAVTPTNSREAYEEFKSRNYDAEPRFLYRPIATEIADLKRRLYGIRIERVEDPAMAQLFYSQQRGLDNQITLLADRGTRRFIYGSMQLYGVPTTEHVDIARHVLATIPVRDSSNSTDKERKLLTASEFAELAQAELDYYKEKDPTFSSSVEIRDDIAGVMVSNGNFLISKHSKITLDRVYSLLQHEVGTHIVTYFNGRAQPLKQLCTGLVGYDELQEGFAVLAEYLSGGLTGTRLRVLAARVVAVDMRIEGASFIETYRELVYRFRFSRLVAFNIVMRVFRGGGFTKDAVYLRGLIWLLDYLSGGGDLDILLVGKMPKEQLPLLRELLWRKVMKDPVLIPRYMDCQDVLEKIDQLRDGLTVSDMSRRMTL